MSQINAAKRFSFFYILICFPGIKYVSAFYITPWQEHTAVCWNSFVRKTTKLDVLSQVSLAAVETVYVWTRWYLSKTAPEISQDLVAVKILDPSCAGLFWEKEKNQMMTSSNGNIFCVTGPLCGEFTGQWWISLTKASDMELWCFLWSASKQTAE